MDELEDLKSKFKCLAADFSNFKKRSEIQSSCIKEKSEAEIILKFLEIYDDMERLDSQISIKELNDDIDYLESGFKIIFENFEKLLNSMGCHKIKCSYGDKFNVDTMEAISTKKLHDSEMYNTNIVVEIYSHGWIRNGKILKHTKVIVGI